MPCICISVGVPTTKQYVRIHTRTHTRTRVLRSRKLGNFQFLIQASIYFCIGLEETDLGMDRLKLTQERQITATERQAKCDKFAEGVVEKEGTYVALGAEFAG